MFLEYAKSLERHCILSDARLEKRFGTIIESLGNNFGKTIPLSFTRRSQVKAAYNFFSHEKITSEMLTAAERDRMMSELKTNIPKVILAVQDTTELIYSGHRSAGLLGAMRYADAKGFYLHNHIFFDQKGVALGIFDQKLWNHPPEVVGKKKEIRKREKFEDKDSYRWFDQFELLQTTFEAQPLFAQTAIIDITDREGDIQELLQARRRDNVHYIIRARGDRSEHLSGKNIRGVAAQTPCISVYDIEVHDARADNKKQKRTARAELRYTVTTLRPPYRHKGYTPVKPVEVGIVYVKEINPPADVKEPVEWILFTSLPVKSPEDALRVIGYYKLRWRIETFHYVLKQGCAVEDLQIEKPQALQNAIVAYSMTALRILNLRHAAAEYGDEPVTEIGFTEKDYFVLAAYLNMRFGTKHRTNKKDVTVNDFIQLLAQLGGHQLGMNKPPGVKTLWRGWSDWQTVSATYKAFNG